MRDVARAARKMPFGTWRGSSAPSWLAAGGALLCFATAGCTSAHRNFHQLAVDAAAVPVPPRLQLLGEQRSTEDGPGFTTDTFEEVTRSFRSPASCARLQSAWVQALTSAHRRFRVRHYPTGVGEVGHWEIDLSDRPEHLGITLGDGPGYCDKPFIWAFNDPH